MSLNTKLLTAVSTLTGLTGNAFAEELNVTLTPNAEKGMKNLATLPYMDKLQWILDTVYALVPFVAILALGFLAIKYYAGGWDSVENEIRSRKAFFAIILVVLALKVGSALVRLISEW